MDTLPDDIWRNLGRSLQSNDCKALACCSSSLGPTALRAAEGAADAARERQAAAAAAYALTCVRCAGCNRSFGRSENAAAKARIKIRLHGGRRCNVSGKHEASYTGPPKGPIMGEKKGVLAKVQG